MGLSASLLNLKFVLLLTILGLIRAVWPRKHFPILVAISSALVIGFAAPRTLIVVAGITLLYLFPLHRLMHAAQERSSRASDSASRDQVQPSVPPGVATSVGNTHTALPATMAGSSPAATAAVLQAGPAAAPVAVTSVASRTTQRVYMTVGVGGLVAILVLFKLNREFTVPWLGGAWMQQQFLALVGFSYFIFRAINFLNIASILRLDERKPWTLLSYTLFPPTISSGPIQKYQDFRQQMANPEPLSKSLVWAAAYRITRGYFRKTVLAFVLYEGVTALLAQPKLTPLYSVAVVLLLYLYFYFDFAGYSDIAIGFGLLMGFRVPENFRRPFLATTVSEYWRNWHITLVDWFRDHVFIPLGGMQSSRKRAALLAMLVMVLCGFWHGFALGFIAWGIWHGAALLIEALSGIKPIPPSRRQGITYWSRLLWTNAIVAMACILFLPDTHSMLKVLTGFISW